jgi:hypothetical protein
MYVVKRYNCTVSLSWASSKGIFHHYRQNNSEKFVSFFKENLEVWVQRHFKGIVLGDGYKNVEKIDKYTFCIMKSSEPRKMQKPAKSLT